MNRFIIASCLILLGCSGLQVRSPSAGNNASIPLALSFNPDRLEESVTLQTAGSGLQAVPAVLKRDGLTNLLVQTFDSASGTLIIMIYDEVLDGHFVASYLCAIPSFYGLAHAEPLGRSPFADDKSGVQMLGILFEGNHGSSVNHDIILAAAWDGQSFEPVLMESATNFCFGDFGPGITCQYDFSLPKEVLIHSQFWGDIERVTKWEESLKWNREARCFYDPEAVASLLKSSNTARRVVGRQRAAFLRNRPSLANICEYDILPYMAIVE